ncbi:exported protein [Staphylococcus petrasii]|uniref:Exported protein n=1 Tax=Staphylococcus petrasii TaxID=1276936 RepID=A0A380G4V1_9STAP|nr:hypothetical protein [Staphylococcus petrasii]PNZ31880.1 hypothetical protein CD137_02310 [Staphylococcus petrasii]TGE12911.1 hypothetical protein E2557_03050 [Staphylococcus petrasii]TGE18701.1 hypothetical protein BJR09_02330 [Staphylococcus petrasii]SUM45001.1 exported protein [Staphylococcus petrasii]
MKKLVAAFLVSGLVMTGVGVNHAEAASGNSIQTVQQLTQGQKTLENITLGESIKNVNNKYGTPIYSKNPNTNEGYYEYRTAKGLIVVTAKGKQNQGYVTRISMTYNAANGPTYNQVKQSVGQNAITRAQYNNVSGNFGYIQKGNTSYQFGSNGPKDKVLKLYRIDVAQ